MSSKKVEKKPLGEPYKTKLRTQEGPTEVASTGSSSKENLKATSGQDLPSAGDGYSSDEDDVPEEFSRFYVSSHSHTPKFYFKESFLKPF